MTVLVSDLQWQLHREEGVVVVKRRPAAMNRVGDVGERAMARAAARREGRRQLEHTMVPGVVLSD